MADEKKKRRRHIGDLRTPDPLLALLDSQVDEGDTQAAVDAAQTVNDILDLIGGNRPPPAKPIGLPTMGINISDEVDDFTDKILNGWKTVETRDTDSLKPYVGQRVGIIQTGQGPARLVGYVTVGEPEHYTSREQFAAATDRHRIYSGTEYDFNDAKGQKFGYPMIDPVAVAPKLVTSKGIVSRSIAPEHLSPFPKMDLPDLTVETRHLRIGKDLKEAIKEIEGYGFTEDNSQVRRVLNSAYVGSDRLLLARNASGVPVAAALVDYRGGKRDPEHVVHELFKQPDAPRHAGSLLMVEAAKAAKEANAEFSVYNALGSARTYYRDMGGDFSPVVQPGGRREVRTSNPRWDSVHRDALAEARPIPTTHWQEPKVVGGKVVKNPDGTMVYADPKPWVKRKKDDEPSHKFLIPPTEPTDRPVPGPDSGGSLQAHAEITQKHVGSRRSRSYANPVQRENLKAHSPDLAYRAAVDQINHRVTEFVRAAYESNPTFLTNHAEIDRITALVAPAVKAGQLQVAQLTNAHLANLFGLENIPQPDGDLLQRNGVDLETELARPFWTAVKAAREGKPINEALAAGEYRMERMLETDYQRAKVVQSREALKANGIETYSRIAGPNACWLCSIAATQVYYTQDLLPIHPGCKCDVAPIPPGGQDSLDTRLNADLVLSKDSSQIKLMTAMVESDVSPADYRELVAVREHSEVGPQLTWAHQKFTGPADLPVPPSKEVLAQQAYDAVRANGGVTIDLAGHVPTDGYAYAPYKTTEFMVPLEEFTPKHIDDYVDAHHAQLARKGNHLGMWVQNGNVYLDVSKVGAPSAETFAKAQAAHQLAVFDLDNFNEINLGTINPATKEYTRLGTSTDLHRQYREQVARADQSRGAAGVPEVPVGAGGNARAATGLKPLEWPGPPVAPPMKAKQIDHYWQAIDTFDDNKDAIRQGARRAERLGYPGWPLDQYGARAYSSKPTKENLLDTGGEFVSRAARSKPTDIEMYRGIQVSPDQLAQLRSSAVGSRISMPVSAFSSDPIAAEGFAYGDPFGMGMDWRPKGTPDGPLESVIFRLEKGAKLADVQSKPSAILEHLGFGEFEITKVEAAGSRLIDHRDPDGFYRDVKVTVVTVKQTSMIEPEAVAPQGGSLRKGATKVAGEEKIPEFAFVGGKTPGRIAPVPDTMRTAEGEKLWPSSLKVARASQRDDVRVMIADHWASLEFDELKDTVRSGVKSVQALGYSGLKEETKFVDLKDELTRYRKFGINAGPQGPSQEMLFLEGQEIAARAVHSKPSTEKMYRGMGLKASDLKSLEPGDELSFPASSFSQHPMAAQGFAKGDYGWKSKDYPQDSKPVVVQVLKGGKFADVSTWSTSESVGFGRFEIVGIEPTAHIGMTGEFIPGPSAFGGGDDVTLITVKQKSLIEAPDNARKVKGDNKIPEYTIIKKPKLSPEGFEDIGGTHLYLQNVDPQAHQGIRDGLADFQAKHPEAHISTVSIEYTLSDAIARAVPSVSNDPRVQGWETRIELNPNYFGEGKYSELDDAVRRSSETRWSISVPEGISPAHAVISHEGGHALDAAGFEQTRKEVNEILTTEFKRLHPELDTGSVYRDYYQAQKSGGSAWIETSDGKVKMTFEEWVADNAEQKEKLNSFRTEYQKWLRDNMSDYSFVDGDRSRAIVNPGEALAEASHDVDLNGDKASLTSKLLQDRMIENAKFDPTMSDIEYGKLRGGLSKKADTPAKSVEQKEKERAARQEAKEYAEAQKLARKTEAEAKKKAAAAAKAAKDAERERKKDASNLKNYGTTDREVVAKIQAEAAAMKAEKRKLLDDAAAKGFGSVKKRIANGTEIKAVTVGGKSDIAATFAKFSTGKGREQLKENWRQAIKGMHAWAREAGKAWYPELNRLCVRLTGMYSDVFKKNLGVELTPDLVSAFMGAFSENNKWANNLVGVRKFLDGTGSMPQHRNLIGLTVNELTAGPDARKFSLAAYDYDKRKVAGLQYDSETGKIVKNTQMYRWLSDLPPSAGIVEAKPIELQQRDGKEYIGLNYDFHVDKALRAAENPKGGVADLRGNASTAPKPADFAANAAGDYSRGTADRWVARIMLHTDDDKFAEKLRNYAVTKDGKRDPLGYKMMSKILEEVAAEFPELTVAAAQAGPWVEVVGPMGSIAYIEDLTSVESVNKETLRRVIAFGEVQ